MANRKMGMLVLALVFGVCMAGYGAPAPNYYNFGEVSNDNYALVRVNPISGNNCKEYSFSMTITHINGYEGWRKWQRSKSLLGEGDAIVRLAPGTYTFTTEFFKSQEALNKRQGTKIDLTYNVEAGKGYSFVFSDNETQTLGLLTVRLGKLTLYENVLDKNKELDFGSFNSIKNSKVVAFETKAPL
jgi:hypothetical protein